MSNVVVASFKWLDTLEKEFDKSFVDVDLMLNNTYMDSENGDLSEEAVADLVDGVREKIKVMSQSWAQLVHKSQTIFQVNCKQEVKNFLQYFYLKFRSKFKSSFQTSF
jgi:hypothetical protein